MSKSIVPLFGHGQSKPVQHKVQPTADMFGVEDELRRQTGAIHARACLQFLKGERADPEISASEMGDMLALAPYERHGRSY